MKEQTIKVMVLESNRMLREGLMKILASQKDMIAVSFGKYEPALAKAAEFKPNVLLMNVGINNLSCTEIMIEFKNKYPEIAIVVINLALYQTSINELVKAGATGFIMKAATIDDFLNAIRSASRGETNLPPGVTTSLISQVVEYGIHHDHNNLVAESVVMIAREQKIINLIAAGRSDTEIATLLNISKETVKTHIHNIMEKLSFRAGVELANFKYAKSTVEETVYKEGFDKPNGDI